MSRTILSEKEILGAVEQAAAKIEARLGNDFVMVPVLAGAMLLAADMLRRLPLGVRVRFAAASSYMNDQAPGPLSVSLLDGPDLSGQKVLVIDTIHDRGKTMRAVRELVQAHGAREVLTFALVRVMRPGLGGPDLCWFGMEPGKFLVGYGLDSASRERGRRDIVAHD